MLGAAVAELYLSAHGDKQLALGLDVADLRDVLEDDLVFRKDGGGHAGKGGVLRAGNADEPSSGLPPRMTNFSMNWELLLQCPLSVR